MRHFNDPLQVIYESISDHESIHLPFKYSVISLRLDSETYISTLLIYERNINLILKRFLLEYSHYFDDECLIDWDYVVQDAQDMSFKDIENVTSLWISDKNITKYFAKDLDTLNSLRVAKDNKYQANLFEFLKYWSNKRDIMNPKDSDSLSFHDL